MPISDTQGGNYDTRAALGYAGQIADASGPQDIASRTVENAVVPFGVAVGLGSGAETCRLGGTAFQGITVADKTRAADQYEVGEKAGVIRKGTVWVTAFNTVAAGGPVTYNAATGVMGAGLAQTIEGAAFETAGTAGDLVRVYLG